MSLDTSKTVRYFERRKSETSDHTRLVDSNNSGETSQSNSNSTNNNSGSGGSSGQTS